MSECESRLAGLEGLLADPIAAYFQGSVLVPRGDFQWLLRLARVKGESQEGGVSVSFDELVDGLWQASVEEDRFNAAVFGLRVAWDGLVRENERLRRLIGQEAAEKEHGASVLRAALGGRDVCRRPS